MSARSSQARASAATVGPKKRLPRGRDRCAGCQSDQRAQLDADLVAKIPYRVLSERYGISTTAVFRHRKHVSVSLVRVDGGPTGISSANGGLANSEDVLGEARRLYEACKALLQNAVEDGNALAITLAAREVRGALELLGRQIERLESRRGALVVDVATLPSFVAMRTKMLRSLAPFPEARLAVAAVLDVDEAAP